MITTPFIRPLVTRMKRARLMGTFRPKPLKEIWTKDGAYLLVLIPGALALTLASIAIHKIVRDTEDVRIFKSDRKSLFRGELKDLDINDDVDIDIVDDIEPLREPPSKSEHESELEPSYDQ